MLYAESAGADSNGVVTFGNVAADGPGGPFQTMDVTLRNGCLLFTLDHADQKSGVVSGRSHVAYIQNICSKSNSLEM